MTDDTRDKPGANEFKRELSGLIQRFADGTDTDTMATVLAQLRDDLAAGELRPTAALTGTGEPQQLTVRYASPLGLEQDLQNIVELGALCVPMDTTPEMLADLDIVVGGAGTTETVTLRGRAVRETPAGIAIQIHQPDAPTRERLETLPELMRESLSEASDMSEPEELGDRPSAAELAARARNRLGGHFSRTGSGFTNRPSTASTARAESGGTRSKRGETKPKFSREYTQLTNFVKTLGRRAHRSDHFEVLGLHWTAFAEEVDDAYERLCTKLSGDGVPEDLDDSMRERISGLRERIDAAYSVLSDDSKRKAYRREITSDFERKSSLEMYESQVDSAKIRRDLPAAVEACRRMLEIDPRHAKAKQDIKVIQDLIDAQRAASRRDS